MNLKILIIISGITVFLSKTYAQYDNTMSVGVNVLPGISTIFSSEKKDRDLRRNSCSFGFIITNEVKENSLYLQTGILSMNRGYKENFDFYDSFGQFITECKTIEIEKYLTIPISLIFQSKYLYAGLGPNFGFITSNKYIVNDQDSHFPRDSIKNKFQIGSQFQLGFTKEIIKNFNLNCELYFNPTFNSKFLNYGIGLGLAYKINTRSLHKFFKRLF